MKASDKHVHCPLKFPDVLLYVAQASLPRLKQPPSLISVTEDYFALYVNSIKYVFFSLLCLSLRIIMLRLIPIVLSIYSCSFLSNYALYGYVTVGLIHSHIYEH